MKLNEKIVKIKNLLLDLILPKLCLVCDQEGSYLCPDCLTTIPLIDKFTCPICQKVSLYGQTCENCQKSSYLAGVISALDYKNPLIKQAIHLFKYRYITELAQPLANLLIKEIKNSHFLSNNFAESKDNFLVIPIPLHRKKFLKRGFNQSELLAKHLTDEFKLTLKTDILSKIKNTHSQTDLKEKERKLNIKDAFELKNKKELKELKGKTVFLIDDVFTTGATLNEAAKILKKAGAQEVWGITLAKD
jgi:competence protein ComFC